MTKKAKIISRLKKGFCYKKIAKEVGCSTATISYHAKKIGLSKGRRPKYDWVQVQKYYNKGFRRIEVIRHFGISQGAWDKARSTGRIKVKDWRIPLEKLLLTGSSASRGNIKLRLLKAGLLKNICSICGITEWMGKSIICRLDHINGVNNDYRIINLRIVCPNCDSQLDTFAGRNVKKNIVR